MTIYNKFSYFFEKIRIGKKTKLSFYYEIASLTWQKKNMSLFLLFITMAKDKYLITQKKNYIFIQKFLYILGLTVIRVLF